MRSAADEMRNAAGDLGRQDPAQASERSSRALDKLRDVERQMRSSLPDEGKRARGDMQLEARQLAEAERQVESALNRAGQGDAGRDAMRRAAGEQERLAERAERLQRELERQAAEAKGAAGGGDQKARQSVAEAAREFERQKIDERLQQSAEALRAAAEQGASGQQPSRAPSSADQQNPQELARALDNLADRLARADNTGDVESQKLSEQMARAEELREKIDELGRQLEKLGQPGQPASANAANQQASTDAGGRGGQGLDSATLERLRKEYAEQMKETRELLNELGRDNTYTQGGPGVTFETPGNMTLSAPGTEAFKQDFARWDALRKQATMALERAQLSISQRLQEKLARDRLATGVDDKPPDTYKQQVDSYFKSLATGRRP
jgi:epidermal growth factor receptor substrate 15